MKRKRQSANQLLINSSKIRRFRRQKGTVLKRRGQFFLRYNADDNGTQRKITVKLCDEDARHHSVDCIPVQLLRDRKMAEVNTAGHAAVTASTVMVDQTIGEFWAAKYLPWATENLRITTSRSYATIWAGYLEAELKNRPLREYKTVDASLFLTGLASRKSSDGKDQSLNRNSLNHVKSLMSGIFTLAKNLGMVDQNPMQGCKALARVRAPKPKVAYSIPETVAIVAAIEKPDAKLFFALCAVLSLRPSEAAGLRWENIVDGMVQVRGAAPYGIVGALKTEQSARDLELIEPVAGLAETWRKACGSPTAGLIFKNEAGGAINHNDYAKKWIAPGGRKACARWHGCYSGRHGGATSLFNLTGDARAANQTLGNSLEVVMETYIKPSSAAGAAGLKLYEAAILEEMRKA